LISRAAVEALKNRRPEWSPWLAVVEAALHETGSNPRWDAAVPDAREAERATPLLSHTTIVVDETTVRRLLTRLVELAARGGTPQMATLQGAIHRNLDIPGLFAASLCQDTDRIVEAAAESGADPEALQAVVGLVSLPFLQACNRKWAAAVPKNWAEGYCPVCGSWPAFSEMRGIERSRYFRCGRCGGEWHSRVLHCGYCGNNNHDDLATLVPEKTGSAGAVEACKRCRCYVKAFTRLQGCKPAAVMVEDLASVDLDVAALEQGYRRPAGSLRDLEITVVTSAPRFLPWNM
jgi:FdhE protein